MVYIFHDVGQRIAYPLTRQFPGPDDGISEYELPTSFLFPETYRVLTPSRGGWEASGILLKESK